MGRDSAVGIGTRYGLDGLGIESLWGRDFPHPSMPAPVGWVPGLFSWGKAAGSGVDHPPHLVRRLKKEYIYISNPLWAFVFCSRVSFTFTVELLLIWEQKVCRYLL